jgi:hypothetical protein
MLFKGRMVDGEFAAFDFSETVTSAGLHSGSTMFVKVLKSLSAADDQNSADEEYREVRERMNRINGTTPKF